MRAKRTVAIVFAAVMLAACGQAEETTTTASPSTTLATTTTTAAPTTTAGPETTTTTEPAPEASGDLSLLHAAMAATTATAPSRIEGLIHMTGLPAGSGVDEVEMPFSVATDPATGDSAFVMDFGAMVTAMGDTEGIPDEMAELMGSMEFRQIGDITYFKFPFFTAFLGAETEWVSMPAEEGGGIAEDMGPGATPSDPGGMLESFSDAEGSVEVLGDEEIRGIQTTRYRLLLDESWHEQLTAEEQAELEAQGFAADTTFPLDLWIGGEGLVHRMSMTMDASQLSDGSGEDFESMTMTFDFFDFGESITIEPPPADQVTDIEDLGGAFGAPSP